MHLDPEKIKSILVVRNDRFGEFLLNIPALRALRQRYRNARMIVVVDPYVYELALALPFVDEVIKWSAKGYSLTEIIKLILFLRKRKIDMAVMLNPSKEFNLVSYFSGIPVRAGYARKWGFLLTHKIKDQKHLGLKHEIEYNLDLVKIAGAQSDDRSLFFPIDEKTGDELLIRLGLAGGLRLVAVHPYTSDPVKQWPFENFQRLAELLAERPDFRVLIIGGKAELPLSRKLFGDIGPGNPVNLTGMLDLKELAALLKKSALLISGDSGPVHLAACVGTPVIALFRSDLPGKAARRWGPWGEGHIVIEKSNLADITVKDVLEKVGEKLKLNAKV